MIKKINEIIEKTDSELVKDVAEGLLNKNENEEYLKSYIEDVLCYGCINGIVSELIYYNDTKKFFIKHIDEILGLLDTYLQQNGVSPVEMIDVNRLAWFGYEYAIQEIKNRI